MRKRYQVFVSSTYKDLPEHRQAVTSALLRADAFPIGMEMFPSTDDDAWTLIRRTIEESDYFVVIIAGMYGSQDADGTSYTEKEYDYAVSCGKPVMAFLHRQPNTLPFHFSESDEVQRRKLEAFRAKAKQKHCNFWMTAADLSVSVLASYHQITLNNPAPGWVRETDLSASSAARQKILNTLWTKLVNRFPFRSLSAWHFRINDNSTEFLPFRKAGTELLIQKLVRETDQGHLELTPLGWEYCLQNHESFPPDQWWPEEQLDPQKLALLWDALSEPGSASGEDGIPSGGSPGQVLQRNGDGKLVWDWVRAH